MPAIWRAIVEELVRRGYDLDEGMPLLYAGAFYHGAECMNRLALLSTAYSLFDRFNSSILQSRTEASPRGETPQPRDGQIAGAREVAEKHDEQERPDGAEQRMTWKARATTTEEQEQRAPARPRQGRPQSG